MAALPLISSAVLLNLTGPRLMPSLGLPDALQSAPMHQTMAYPFLAASSTATSLPLHLVATPLYFRLITGRATVASAQHWSHGSTGGSSRACVEELRSGSLVEQAADDDQTICP